MMKRNILLSCLGILWLNTSYAFQEKDCNHNCFSTEVKSVESTEDGCYNYTLEVSYSGDCTYALSHFTLDTDCGNIISLSNSENWKQEIGNIDPTTGLSGFKIDDIKGFGEEKGSGIFTVNFTLCPDNAECASALSCWSPVVAYKAGQCVYYDTLDYQCKKLEAEIIAQNPSCADSEDGALNIEIIEGREPFEFIWSNGSNDQNISGLSGGYYSVVIKDAHGDTLNLAAELITPEPLSLNYEITNASCDGTNGSVIVNATGGAGSYSYRWLNDSTGSALGNLAPGTYSVKVTDSMGCEFSQSFTVETIDQLIITGDVSKASCFGNDGSIEISVSGGSGGYSYSWLDGADTEDRENLSPGYYTVKITDDGGCESSKTFSVKENNTISIIGSVVPTGCPDDSTGGVKLTVSGTTGAVNYLWSNGDTSESLAGVGTGRYEVTVTDSTGCSSTKSFYVFGEKISVESDVKHPTCHGASDGSISLSSDEEIEVSWSTGENSSTIEGLSEGLYIATVTNASGCSNTFSYVFSSPEEITFTQNIINGNCDSTAFSAEIIVSGGVAPYEIAWEDGATGSVRDSLTDGDYQLTITDANGCHASGTIEVNASTAQCPDNNDENDSTDEDDSDAEEEDAGEENDTDDNEDNNDEEQEENNDGNTSEDGEEENPGDDDADEESDGDNQSDGDNEDDETDGEENDDEEDENQQPGEDITEENGSPKELECGDPYNIELTLVESGECLVYEGYIRYSGEKSFALSHAVLSPSCGTISGDFTDIGQFESGSDPTTGLNGLKIDEISGFGETDNPQSLYFTFELCPEECNDGQNLSFVVAYKFGQCTIYDSVSVEMPQARTTATPYPNPAAGKVFFDMISKADITLVQLYNLYGIMVIEKEFTKGEQLLLDINNLQNDIYSYRIISGDEVRSGKIIVKN